MADFREQLKLEYKGNDNYNLYWCKEDLSVEGPEGDTLIVSSVVIKDICGEHVSEFLDEHFYDIVHIFFLLIYNDTVRIIDEY